MEPATGPPQGLPPELEERCYDLWFDSPASVRGEVFDGLCSEQPGFADSIRELGARLERSDTALGRLRDEVERPGPPPRIGDFEILGELGRGGFGVVYRALQLEPIRRTVALKILQPGLLQERALARFALERQALAQMQHPAIAQVHDAGTTPDGRPYIAMEFVEGTPITAYCDARRLDVEARLRLFTAACDGVTHAHQRGIVHRDLKPTNLLVVERDGTPQPKIIDFGVAKALDDSLGSTAEVTIDGAFVGTPAYTSPEQASGRPVDTRTDVHALGVLLHELLTGDLPYGRAAEGVSLGETLRRIREQRPRPPASACARPGKTSPSGAAPRHAACSGACRATSTVS